MRVETIHPSEMGAPEWARWEALRSADAALASPYYSARWAQIASTARPDSRICVIDGGRGFFGAQKLSAFTAMPLGSPLCDYQGVVGVNNVSAAALCRALEVGRIDFTHAPATQRALMAGRQGESGSWIVELRGAAEDYRAGLRERRPDCVRQWDKKLRRLTKEHGAASFSAESKDAASFKTLLAWKDAQLRRTGQPPIWETPWVRQVVEQCFAADRHAFGGALFTLHCGDTLVAANFCLRGASVLHCWIIGHDPAFDAYSPGVLLARQIVEWAADNHFCEVDFGPGAYQFKRQLATSQRPLAWGYVARPSFAGAVRGAEYAVRRALERTPLEAVAALPGKAMRRLDVIRGLGTR